MFRVPRATGVVAALSLLGACGSSSEPDEVGNTMAPSATSEIASSGDDVDNVAEPSALTTPVSDDTTNEVPSDTTNETTTDSRATMILHDFTNPDSVDGWNVRNDTVMGGVSESAVDWLEGTLLFAGRVSLDNNGGFASLRGPVLDAVPAGAEALAVTAIGDGRTYVVQLLTDTDSYIRRFVAEPGESEHLMPFDEFGATSFMLQPVTPIAPLMSQNIRQIAVYILDKQEGEFELRLRSIDLRR